MKRLPFFSALLSFAVAFLLVGSDLVHAQLLRGRRDTAQPTQSVQPTRQTPTQTSAQTPVQTPEQNPEQTPTATRSADVPASRGVTLEFMPSQLVAKPRSWAVLVGVNEYVKLANLSYCVNDIKAIEASLLQTGFGEDTVFTLTSGAEEKDLPTRNNIVQVVQLVCRSAGPEDFVFIALNGHGIQIGDVQYFCPSDMDDLEERLAETAMSIDWIYKELENSAAKFKLLVVDACRDNPFRGRRSALVAEMGITRDPPPGIALLRSCGPGEVSLEDAQFQKGVFTHFLLEGLNGAADMNKDGAVSFLELYMYTQRQTQAYALRNHRSQQNPYIRGELTDFPFAQGYAEAEGPDGAGAPDAVGMSVASDAESPGFDPQMEMMRVLFEELNRLRTALEEARRQQNARRIGELQNQIAALEEMVKEIMAPPPPPPPPPVQRTVVVQESAPRPPTPRLTEAEVNRIVNQHIARTAKWESGAEIRALREYVHRYGRLPSGAFSELTPGYQRAVQRGAPAGLMQYYQ